MRLVYKPIFGIFCLWLGQMLACVVGTDCLEDVLKNLQYLHWK